MADPGAAAAEVKQITAELLDHMRSVAKRKDKKPTKADQQREAEIKAKLEAAQEKRSESTVQVEFQSLPEDEWEAAIADLDGDAQESYDLSAILPVITAASCTDPELQDADWWAGYFKRPSWTIGDKESLRHTLLSLNLSAPRFEALGKG